MRLRDYRLFILDLDDTLYLERDYVLSGLSAVAKYMAHCHELNEDDLRSWLHNRFLDRGRDHILNHCLTTFALPCTPSVIEQLVEVYRAHEPDLTLLPGTGQLLDSLSGIGHVVVLTDGLPSMQANKCRALGLPERVDRIIYCWEVKAPKPDIASIVPVLCEFEGPAILIGDNPGHDICLANRVGMPTIRVRQGRFANIDTEPFQSVFDLKGISNLLSYL